MALHRTLMRFVVLSGAFMQHIHLRQRHEDIFEVAQVGQCDKPVETEVEEQAPERYLPTSGCEAVGCISSPCSIGTRAMLSVGNWIRRSRCPLCSTPLIVP